jgi:hypothetical protein
MIDDSDRRPLATGSGAVKANQTDPATVVEVQFPVEKAK